MLGAQDRESCDVIPVFSPELGHSLDAIILKEG